MGQGRGRDKILGNQEYKNTKSKNLKDLIQKLLFSITNQVPIKYQYNLRISRKSSTAGRPDSIICSHSK